MTNIIYTESSANVIMAAVGANMYRGVKQKQKALLEEGIEANTIVATDLYFEESLQDIHRHFSNYIGHFFQSSELSVEEYDFSVEQMSYYLGCALIEIAEGRSSDSTYKSEFCASLTSENTDENSSFTFGQLVHDLARDMSGERAEESTDLL